MIQELSQTAGPLILVENGKMPNDSSHISHWIVLPAQTPFGNLTRKFGLIVEDVDQLNRRIMEFNSIWILMNSEPPENDPAFFGGLFPRYRCLQEEIIYWMKVIADEILMLSSILLERTMADSYPTKVRVDCIGVLMSDKSGTAQALRVEMKANFESLCMLNECANTLKHSVLQSDASLYNPGTPIVFFLPLKKNELLASTSIEYKEEEMVELLISFNSFFKKAKFLMREWGKVALEMDRRNT